ncbi:hypothetical protein [Streptomyces sp. NPDC058623]|uniref:hypothetical protein n=1 Tax=Streptomyces sp. NPDC058623 TaxID=3346563 RepID=UPI0036539474
MIVATKVADTITFDEGSDVLRALFVAQQCMAGRGLLPLPQSGSPVQVAAWAPGAAGLDPYVRLLSAYRRSSYGSPPPPIMSARGPGSP